MNCIFAAFSVSIKPHQRYSIANVINQQLCQLGIGLSFLGFSLLPTVTTTNSALAAETISVSYGLLGRSISVDALETYAKEGKLKPDLAVYADNFSPQQLAQLRRVLMTEIDISPVGVAQFLYTPVGETLLERLGQIVQTESRQSGFYALRSALILAAADSQGLTLLNVLKKFPTRSIQIDLRRSLQVAENLKVLIEQTQQAVASIKQQSARTATIPQKLQVSSLPDLRRQGRFNWKQLTLRLHDRRRDRTFLADIYLPRVVQPVPVIVISHGLGSDRKSFTYLAQQLASYGFAVAVPDHPGSNSQQLQALLNGVAAEVAEPIEFINRPLDIKFLLDTLQKVDSSNPSWQLNLQQVGVIGQSFGGYTALALAGGELNFAQLQKDCTSLNESLNVSLLLQCQALQLATKDDKLRDQRVKAAIAINPITSSIFGKAGLSQIQIPVMFVTSSADTVAPALPEQIIPFTWLTAKEKYLVLLERGTHFSTIGESKPGTDPIALPTQAVGPNPAIARRYINGLSVAFFETYINAVPQYRSYLSASYVESISQAPLALSLVRSLAKIQLIQSAQ